jgi:transcription initiation factor TFIIIB Brf1 subunit/transcription initiation factor TFIIB
MWPGGSTAPDPLSYEGSFSTSVPSETEREEGHHEATQHEQWGRTMPEDMSTICPSCKTPFANINGEIVCRNCGYVAGFAYEPPTFINEPVSSRFITSIRARWNDRELLKANNRVNQLETSKLRLYYIIKGLAGRLHLSKHIIEEAYKIAKKIQTIGRDNAALAVASIYAACINNRQYIQLEEILEHIHANRTNVKKYLEKIHMNRIAKYNSEKITPLIDKALAELKLEQLREKAYNILKSGRWDGMKPKNIAGYVIYKACKDARIPIPKAQIARTLKLSPGIIGIIEKRLMNRENKRTNIPTTPQHTKQKITLLVYMRIP